jgi:hypothetical protein
MYSAAAMLPPMDLALANRICTPGNLNDFLGRGIVPEDLKRGGGNLFIPTWFMIRYGLRVAMALCRIGWPFGRSFFIHQRGDRL